MLPWFPGRHPLYGYCEQQQGIMMYKEASIGRRLKQIGLLLNLKRLLMSSVWLAKHDSWLFFSIFLTLKYVIIYQTTFVYSNMPMPTRVLNL